jgi:hypothetical protein
MGRRHLLLEPPSCRGGWEVRTHDILRPGRNYLVAATWVGPIELTGIADEPTVGRSQRGPPIAHRLGPVEPPTGPDHPTRVRNSLRRKGSHVRTTHCITSQVGPKPPASRQSSLNQRRHAR